MKLALKLKEFETRKRGNDFTSAPKTKCNYQFIIQSNPINRIEISFAIIANIHWWFDEENQIETGCMAVVFPSDFETLPPTYEELWSIAKIAVDKINESYKSKGEPFVNLNVCALEEFDAAKLKIEYDSWKGLN